MNAGVSASWHSLCSLLTDKSVVPYNTKHTLSWGGSRNRADRVSDSLSLIKAKQIIAAAYQAKNISTPFNLFLTVHWTRAALSDAQAAKATGDLIKYISDWMRTKGVKATWAWVRENDYGDGSKGSHVHIMLHCPASLPIAKHFRRWLRKVTGRPYRKGVIKTERIGSTLNAYATSPALYAENLDRVIAYCVKGVTPADALTLSLPKQQDGGRIIGKRCSISQNLNKPVDAKAND